jgi:hypothetical protein
MPHSPELRGLRLPAVPVAIFRLLLPIADREEVIVDLEAEVRHRNRVLNS